MLLVYRWLVSMEFADTRLGNKAIAIGPSGTVALSNRIIGSQLTLPRPQTSDAPFTSCPLLIVWSQIVLHFAQYHCTLFFYSLDAFFAIPDSKLHGAYMGPIWVLSARDGPHVGPMNLAIRDISVITSVDSAPDIITHPCPNFNGRS